MENLQQVTCNFMPYLFQSEDIDLWLQSILRFDVLLFPVLLELFFKLLIPRLPICNLDKTGANVTILLMSFLNKLYSPLCTCCSSRALSSSMSRTLSLSSATRCSHSCCSLFLPSCSSLSNRSRSARSSFCARSCSVRSSLCSLWAWTPKQYLNH